MSLSSSRPQTPIRRISRGSIGASPSSSRTGGSSSLPPALAHLDRALGQLGDETTALEANLAQWQTIGESLSVFGESFSSFLYGLRMNAFTVDWSERPLADAPASVRDRKELLASLDSAGPANVATAQPTITASVAAPDSVMADTTYATADESALLADASFPLPPLVAATAAHHPTPNSRTAAHPVPFKVRQVSAPGNASGSGSGAGAGAKKKPVKSALKKPSAASKGPKLTPAEMKQRDAFVSDTIDRLPLEWRGSDPALTKVAQTTLRALISAGDAGSHLPELVSATKLPRVQVNKTLNALVLAKQVVKDQDASGAVYLLNVLP